ncbi:glycosyltransferase WbuB [Halobacillus trueperi]|uniref:Glycosyltransferase WbuB n=1 Tax=Halobacillus trueperi TaxID=156205 RepID=A0A3D8VQL3_9BACI|nr:glycosyltransferase [Halobacillus trueperi]RDY71694.1 glycosyltransferase WbuB [Halobacillus trueperi]
MKKVLHILFHSVPNNNGYSIRSKYIVENIKKNFEVQVITSPYQESHGKLETYDSVNYHRLFNHKSSKSQLIKNIIMIRKEILKLNNKEHFDLIHVHSPWIIAIPSILASKKLNIPVIYEVRGAWEDTDVAIGKKTESSIKYKIIRKIETWCMKNADHIVSISKGLKRDMIKRGIDKNKISHISNGVDTNKFNPAFISESTKLNLKSKYGIKDKDLVVGYISSLRKLEGVQNLIEAAKNLETKVSFKFLIVGDGEYRRELEDIVKENNLEEKFIFTGKVNHLEIINYYSLIDIFVIPRIKARVNEIVTPLKPYEAMSMNKPLIVSDVGGLLEIIEEGATGIAYDKNNPRDLAVKLELLASDKEFRFSLGSTARSYAQRFYDWEIVAKKYKEIYTHLTKDIM